jgi:iron complex transport system substrate-binding protein
MRKRILVLALAALLASTSWLMGGCAAKTGQQPQGPQKVTVTDLLGRQVEVTVPASKVVAIGPGALRLVCYVDLADRVVGIEDMDKKDSIGRPYILANSTLPSLPGIGQGGPDSAVDPEKLVSVTPDVIFASQLLDKSKADDLQARTGIPVVMLSYGTVAPFDQAIYDSLDLIGKVTGQDARAQDVVGYLKGCQQDLQARTKDIPDSQKPKVYVGGLGMKGTHGIESTQGKYAPFAAINAINVADETGKAGSVSIDREKLVQWNPDYIFIDESGYPLVQQDYQKNPQFYKSLTAVQKGELYGQIPFNYYNTNLDTAIADAYYAGKAIFPDKFQDVDPVQKADEIYTKLLGKAVYDQMAKAFGGFKKVSLD